MENKDTEKTIADNYYEFADLVELVDTLGIGRKTVFRGKSPDGYHKYNVILYRYKEHEFSYLTCEIETESEVPPTTSMVLDILLREAIYSPKGGIKVKLKRLLKEYYEAAETLVREHLGEEE